MTGDLRTRVEALRDKMAARPRSQVAYWAEQLTRILDADPDPPTTEWWHTHFGDAVYCQRECRPGFKHSQCGCSGDHRRPDAPVDDGLVEQIARVLVEAGCNDPWHIVKRCARALVVARPWQAEVEAARDVPTSEPGDYVEAWFRLTLNHPDTKAAAFVAMHVSRLVEERDNARARVEAARQDTLDAVIERADDGIEFGPKNCLLLTRIVTDVRDRAARGETRQP